MNVFVDQQLGAIIEVDANCTVREHVTEAML